MKKKLLLSIITVWIATYSTAQLPTTLPLLSNWSDSNIPPAFYGSYNDCWGYVDANGREYAIMGSSVGTHFFDITDPANPVYISFQPTKDPNTLSIHRDFKTYQHYAYGVTDQGDNSLQIFDLQYLPDSVVKVYDSNVLTKRCHNIHIEGDKLYLASNTVGNNFHAMDVVSLADPVNPVLLSTLFNPAFTHVHDVFVRNDTAYCSVGYDGLYVYSYVNPTTPQLLMSLTSYPEQGYNHSAWMKPGTFELVMADENHGSGLKIVDLSDFGNPVVKSVFRSNLLNVPVPNGQNGSIVHNPFIRDDYVYLAYYHDGVQVFDISDASNPVWTSFYDTHPQNTNYASYTGCWGVYPFLPSGNIIASDMVNGLFVFDGSSLTSVQNPDDNNLSMSVYPNPFNDQIRIRLPEGVGSEVEIRISDMTGRVVFFSNQPQVGLMTVPSSPFTPGTYTITIRSKERVEVRKVVKLGQ
jgi:choice-of-anchor B domain-containing protein